ncbi:unnamed protein product, partial [marine sediment metagenome]
VDGERFHDESPWYGHITGVGMSQPGGAYWAVYDSKIREAPRPVKSTPSMDKTKEVKANTIEELARSAGIDAEGLKKTIDKYNSDIDSVGYDTVFGREHLFGPAGLLVKIGAPPFYAVKCATSITSMKGGLKINGRSQVINQYSEVIPSLYAGGEVAGGLHGKSYLLGVMTSGAVTQGIIAGKNAVKEPAF